MPWFSRRDLPWPQNARRRKKKFFTTQQKLEQAEEKHTESETAETVTTSDSDDTFTPTPETPSTTQPPSEHAPSERGASELASTTPTTPSSAQPASADMSRTITPTSAKVAPRAIALPLIPAIAKVKAHAKTTSLATTPKATTPKKEAAKETKAKAAPKPAPAPVSVVEKAVDIINKVAGTSFTASADNVEAKEETPPEATPTEEATPAPAPAPAPVKPSSWAALLKKPDPATPKAAAPQSSSQTEQAEKLPKSNTENLADALSSFNAKVKDSKIAFLEPRGLVNTGNMCYMNSVLQVLVFCVPFYDFLEQVGKNAKHSFKSDTPLIDAM